ncbi:MAG TPA: hypothetical protein VK469_15060 [Candidatus Kapabacteria bacterium]|nr:hypothetical protein [Candidatus Kapabacteria bacterium]
MQSRTLNKITREFFSGYPPIYVESLSEQKNIIDGLKEKIKENKDIRIKIEEPMTYYGQKAIDKERYLYLEILNSHKHWHWSDSARLAISFEKEKDRGKLYIKPAFEEQTYNFSGQAADLFKFINHIMEKYKEIDNRKTKTDKIKKLKKGAVLARIKELAKKNQFNFNLEEFRHKLQLSIQIGEKGIVTMDILYSKFQQEMGKIEDIVHAAKELDKSGIVTNLNFKSQNNAHQIRNFTKYYEP